MSEAGGAARLRTLRAVEAALRAEAAAARLRLQDAGARARRPPDPDGGAADDAGGDAGDALRRARCRVRENNARAAAQLEEAAAALEARLAETRARVRKRKSEEHDLRALADELDKEKHGAATRRAREGPAQPAAQDEAEENEKLVRLARVFLGNHFPVEGDVGFWKRFLKMPRAVDLAGADDAHALVNTLLASGLCVEPDEDNDEDVPPVGAKRFLIVS